MEHWGNVQWIPHFRRREATAGNTSAFAAYQTRGLCITFDNNKKEKISRKICKWKINSNYFTMHVFVMDFCGNQIINTRDFGEKKLKIRPTDRSPVPGVRLVGSSEKIGDREKKMRGGVWGESEKASRLSLLAIFPLAVRHAIPDLMGNSFLVNLDCPSRRYAFSSPLGFFASLSRLKQRSHTGYRNITTAYMKTYVSRVKAMPAKRSDPVLSRNEC